MKTNDKTRKQTLLHFQKLNRAAFECKVHLCRAYVTGKTACVWDGFAIPVSHEHPEPFGTLPFEKVKAELRAFRAASRMAPDPLELPRGRRNRFDVAREGGGTPAFIRRRKIDDAVRYDNSVKDAVKAERLAA